MTDQTPGNSRSSEAAPVIEGFRVLERLGHGTTSSVWKAEQVSLNRLVVIKVLSERLAHEPEDVALFKAEARMAANFKHPGIVQVYDFDQSITSRCYYFVMEHISGYSVGDWIRRKGKIAESDALIVAHVVADAMKYAWNLSKIAHCDIKPDNIMVDGDGSIKVADMGLAHTVKTIASQPGADANEVIITGTPNYMAPEQVRGTDPIDCRADIYALGATLSHMVTGQLPFGDSPPDIVLERRRHETFEYPQLVNPDLSAGITRLIVKMTAKEPSARFQTWDEVLEEVIRLERQMRQQAAASIQPVAAVAEATVSAERPPSADSKNDSALAKDVCVCPYCGKPLQPQALYCEFCGKSVAGPAKKTGKDQKHVVVRLKPTLVSSPAGAPPSATRPAPRLRSASRRRRTSWGGYFRILLSLCLLAFLGHYAYQKIKYDHDVIIPIKAAIIRSVQPVFEKGCLLAEQGLKGITQWSYKLLWARFSTRPAPPAELPEEAQKEMPAPLAELPEEAQKEMPAPPAELPEEAPKESLTAESKPEEAPPVTEPETGTEAEKFYPRGERFCFSFYSIKKEDSAYAFERGATAIGPYYGGQGSVLAQARAMTAPLIYSVQPACMSFHNWDRDPPPNKSLVVEQVTQIVNALKDEPLIIMWYIGAEELRHWRKAELQYLEWITSTIRKFDSQRRPVFMYEPNNRTASALKKTLVFQDVCAKGMYVNWGGHRHNRIWARWSMDQVTKGASAVRRRQVLPWVVLEMFADAPGNEQRKQIEAQCRHDAYLALVMGAKGILVFSGFRGRSGFQHDFQTYLDSYLSVATDLNGPMGLASIFLKGSELRSIRMNVNKGPQWLDLKYDGRHRYRPVTWTTRELDGKQYLFVVNSAETDVQVTFTGLPLLPWESLFEEGVQGKAHGQLQVKLPPLGVKAYRFSNPTRSAT